MKNEIVPIIPHDRELLLRRTSGDTVAELKLETRQQNW